MDPSDLQSRSGTSYGTLRDGTGIKIGLARVSTANQDLTVQRDGLTALGVDAGRVHVDPAPPAPGQGFARPSLPAAPATPSWKRGMARVTQN